MNHLKRFPHYRQHNASDCGPTSLRMVAKFYGMDYSAEMLRKHCHISRRGVTQDRRPHDTLSVLPEIEDGEYYGFRHTL